MKSTSKFHPSVNYNNVTYTLEVRWNKEEGWHTFLDGVPYRRAVETAKQISPEWDVRLLREEYNVREIYCDKLSERR